MALLERDHQLGLLRGLLAEAARGRGRLAALAGEAGVGKTALTQALAEAAPEGTRILRGACEDLVVAEPLGPLRDLAREARWDLGHAIAQHEERLSVFSEALEAFDRPGCATLLVIEDLHWADEATLDFVRFLGRRIRNAHLLLLVTARDDEAGGRSHLRRALADVPPDNVLRIDLAPLTREAVGGLARTAGMDGGAVFRATSGNPFFVTELIRGGREDPPPPSVQDVVLRRADRLSAEARQLLDASSIFPRRVEMQTLADLSGAGAEAGLEECVAAGILQATDEGPAFRHELARRAVESALPAARRRDLNAAALGLLRARPGTPLARMLHHARAAGDGAAVRELAAGAGREAAQVGAHGEAAEHYLAALDHAQTFPVDERIALYEACAHECYLAGRNLEAISTLKLALALYHARQDRVREGECERWLSRFNYQLGDIAAVRGHAERALELLEGTDGPELAMAYSTLSQVAMLGDDVEQTFRYGERAVALANRLNLTDVLCHALINIGYAGRWVDPIEGRRKIEHGLELARRISNHDHCARAYTNLAWLDMTMLDLDRALETLRSGLAYCAEHELPAYGTYQRATLAEILLRKGDAERAQAEALRALDHDRPVRLSRFVATLVLARLRTRAGSAQVEPLLDYLVKYLETGKELQRFAPYVALVAEQAWLGLSERQVALRLIDEAVDMASDPVMIPEIFTWRRLLAPEQELPDTGRMPEPYRLMLAGDWQAAADAWARVGAPFDEAIALLEGGPEAQRRALAIFEGLGATCVADHVRGLLRQSGTRIVAQGPRASTRDNPAGLTRRQMDVLRLLDAGHSNATIAERLFVSPKTVDHHVSAILAKLEVGTRGEAAAAARRAKLI